MVTLTKKMVIPSDLQAARTVEEALLREVCCCGYNEAAVFAIKLALEEGLTNAIKHGNGYDRTKIVEVAYDVDRQKTVIVITDEGRGFDPNSVPDPTADENLEKPCGRGILLMRKYMDQVDYTGRGNQVHMIKHNR